MALIPLALAQDYSFATSPEDYGEFYPTAYKDQGGTTDWNCGSITYSGHDGSDFGVGSWDGMDEGRDVVAAADGSVVYTNDGEDDECSTGDCDGGGGFGNYVKLEHADGKFTYYAHMKTWSVAVATGDSVVCGQKIGEVGSSGYSTGPHLHFEVRTSGGTATDPFEGSCSAPPSYWIDQGVYDELPTLECADVEACVPAARLSCGETISASNDGSGASSSHYAYGCDEFSYSGPEIAYSFGTSLDEQVTLSVTGLGADLDLFLLGSDACDGSDSLGCSTGSDASDESITFTATAGATYTVVLDGWEGATSSFSLAAACDGGGGGEDTGEPPDTDTPADTDAPPDTGEPWYDDSERETAPLPGQPIRFDAIGGCATAPAPLGLLLAALAGAGMSRRRH